MSARRNRKLGILVAAAILVGCSGAGTSDPVEEGQEVVTPETEAVSQPDEGAPGEENVGTSEQPLVLPLACAGAQWVVASRMPDSDKVKHCTATCRSVRYCGLAAAGGAGVMKEIVDTLCQRAPDDVKRALRSVSQCGGWDNDDMRANAKGGSCAIRIWRGCDTCCRD